jgi:hypothetical protein
MSTRLNTPQLQQSFHLFVINSTRKVMCNGLVVVVVVSVAAEHLQFFFLFGDPLTTRRASDAIGSPWRIKRAIDRPVRSRTACYHSAWWWQQWWCAVISVVRRGLVVGVRIYVQAKG